jgi:hypothetical protein
MVAQTRAVEYFGRDSAVCAAAQCGNDGLDDFFSQIGL